jgi:hypothetical protein
MRNIFKGKCKENNGNRSILQRNAFRIRIGKEGETQIEGQERSHDCTGGHKSGNRYNSENEKQYTDKKSGKTSNYLKKCLEER